MTKLKAVILVESGVQDQEFWTPHDRLKEAGFKVLIASNPEATRAAKDGKPLLGKYGIPIVPTHIYDYISDTIDEYSIIIVPGGWESPERMRQNDSAIQIVQRALFHNKIVGAICHGPLVLISANVVKGRTMSCYKGMKDDLINAGANYTEADVVVDPPSQDRPGWIVSSPHYRNNPDFMREILRLYELQTKAANPA